jgi:aryl-alcohol dehydrogenase-like predicted oxidoreductase
VDTRTIGSLTVSVVGLGCNNFGGRIDEERTRSVVAAALDAGITLFDTADIYGGKGASEELLGRALGARRDDVIVATKFGMPMSDDLAGAHPDYVRAACEASLRRLGTDRIDLYQQHAPDPSVPLDDTIAALEELRDEGKVVEIGCSNFEPGMLDGRWASVQNELSLLRRKGLEELVEACSAHGLGILPYFPLASGMLTGKYQRGEAPPEGTRLAGVPDERRERAMSDQAFDRVEALTAFAESRGHTLLELAMSWLAGLPQMASVIAGATTAEQVRANAAAVGWDLTDDERAQVDRLTT